MLKLIIEVFVISGLLYALALALPGLRLKSFGTTLVVVVVYGVLKSSKVLSLLTPCPSLGYVWTVSTESIESPPRHPMCVIGSSSAPSA